MFDSEYSIKLYELYESSSSIYMVLEYLEGGELATRLHTVKGYTEKKAHKLMQNILNAVNTLWE